MIKIELPMPSATLSPNVRSHWATKSREVKKHRNKAKMHLHLEDVDPVRVNNYHLHFVFPDYKRRDLDNFTARCKSYLDGISDYFEQDDSLWDMCAPTREVKKGKNIVIITLS